MFLFLGVLCRPAFAEHRGACVDAAPVGGGQDERGAGGHGGVRGLRDQRALAAHCHTPRRCPPAPRPAAATPRPLSACSALHLRQRTLLLLPAAAAPPVGLSAAAPTAAVRVTAAAPPVPVPVPAPLSPPAHIAAPQPALRPGTCADGGVAGRESGICTGLFYKVSARHPLARNSFFSGTFQGQKAHFSARTSTQKTHP